PAMWHCARATGDLTLILPVVQICLNHTHFFPVCLQFFGYDHWERSLDILPQLRIWRIDHHVSTWRDGEKAVERLGLSEDFRSADHFHFGRIATEPVKSDNQAPDRGSRDLQKVSSACFDDCAHDYLALAARATASRIL